ncbi:MAG: hypothetical protein AAF624_09525 [Bacteroidota bacterium]
MKQLLHEAVTRIRDFERRWADARGYEHFSLLAARQHGEFGHERELPGSSLHFYLFHGRGCTIGFDDGVVDYDYTRFVAEPPEHLPIEFHWWKLYRTVLSLDRCDPEFFPPLGAKSGDLAWLRSLHAGELMTLVDEQYSSYQVEEDALARAIGH